MEMSHDRARESPTAPLGVKPFLLQLLEKHMAKRHTGSPAHVLTFDEAVEVWLMHWDGSIQSRIAAHFDTNQGRISEVLKGERLPGSRDEAERRRGRAA